MKETSGNSEQQSNKGGKLFLLLMENLIKNSHSYKIAQYYDMILECEHMVIMTDTL